ncbi:GntR family transcriptional regulator [Aurantimonas sp. C2-5-R2]|uniref:GntR family transcriptional regulator n=1 Tax=Aurantimonas sp. C2-5-R2 TaxID=3113713 RepID=UPI002F91F02C
MAFRTKQDHVAEVLRERIISGVYERGEKLRQGDIAEELEVSLTPVREAMKILEAEGYIISMSHRGVLVPPFYVEQAEELFELRMLLERRLTENAFNRMTSERLAELEAIQAEYATATSSMDRNQLRSANYRFHFRMYEWANEPQTLAFVRVLWAKYPFHYLDAIKSRTTRAVREHQAFLIQAQAGNVEGALEAMEEHIRAGWKEFSQQQIVNVASP